MQRGVLSLKSSVCANGEAYEYRLFCSMSESTSRQLGRSVFVLGDTVRAHEIALGRIMNDLIQNRHISE